MIKAETQQIGTLPTELIKLMNKGERKRSPKTVIKAPGRPVHGGSIKWRACGVWQSIGRWCNVFSDYRCHGRSSV